MLNSTTAYYTAIIIIIIITARTIHNNRPDMVILDKIIKGYLIDAAIPNSNT
jgi:hypothetical protein